MSEMIILQNGRLIDPASGRDEIADIWVKNGRIVAAAGEIPSAANRFDLAGKCWSPASSICTSICVNPGRSTRKR